jgi:hypothetical protein
MVWYRGSNMWRGRRWCGKNTVWGKTITPTCSGKFIESLIHCVEQNSRRKG